MHGAVVIVDNVVCEVVCKKRHDTADVTVSRRYHVTVNRNTAVNKPSLSVEDHVESFPLFLRQLIVGIVRIDYHRCTPSWAPHKSPNFNRHGQSTATKQEIVNQVFKCELLLNRIENGEPHEILKFYFGPALVTNAVDVVPIKPCYGPSRLCQLSFR